MTEQNEIQRIDSKTSIGFPENSSNLDKNSKEKKKIVSEVKEREELVADVCHVLIYCERHQKICVSKVLSKGLWLPSIPIRYNDSWTLAANVLLEKIGLKIEPFLNSSGEQINVFRIQMTQTSNFVTRHTFLVRIPKDPKQSNCCLDDEKYKWIAVKSVIQCGSDYFWGPEVQMWVRFWIQNENIKIVKHINEYDTRDALKDYCDQPTPCTSNQQLMIRSACFVEKDILRVYDLFLQHCYPSQFMTYTSFKLFIRKIGLKLSENHMIPTFRAFDCRQRSYLNFNQLLSGLAAMDQATEHGKESGQIRCTYIMRFYDSDSDGFLSHSDICHMISDIQKVPNSPHKDLYDSKKSSIEEYANQIIKSHGTDSRISLTEFTNAIGSLKLRGTSSLFRATGPTLKLVMKLMTTEKSNWYSVELVRHNKYESCCESCRQRSYRISRLVYTMSRSGEVLSFIDLSQAFPKIDFLKDIPDMETFELATELINKIHQVKTSRLDFNDIRYSEDKTTTNWFYSSKQVLIQKLLNICEKSKQVFEKEERVLSLSSPCYVFGDIHGNLKDLMIFANDFWRMSPLISESKYLFLGDFVDRGLFGVECIMYLFALKLMAPKTFCMCRGNHEVRALQESFTFYNECVDGYSLELWNAINETFDRLPIAAVIDNKLFCSHGGIPTSTNSIQVLRMAPNILSDPQTQSPPVWECLWNDPISEDEFRQLSSFDRKELQEMKGFIANAKRGTAFYYAEQAIDEFCEHNDIQYIIRGHECQALGYKFQYNGKIITIFSTSLYCNTRNNAAVLYVKQNKLRIIRVHTFD